MPNIVERLVGDQFYSRALILRSKSRSLNDHSLHDYILCDVHLRVVLRGLLALFTTHVRVNKAIAAHGIKLVEVGVFRVGHGLRGMFLLIAIHYIVLHIVLHTVLVAQLGLLRVYIDLHIGRVYIHVHLV